MTNSPAQKNSTNKTVFIASTVAYTLVVLVAATLLFTEPDGFSAQAMIFPLVTALLLSSLGMAYRFASKSANKTLVIAGTVALTVLFAFIGFFVVAAIGWFIALSYAQ